MTARDVWVANFDDDTVSRVNMKTNRVVGEPAKVGAGPVAIASGHSGVWVVNYGAGTIQRIDPTTGQADKAFPVGHGPDGIVMDDTSIWVTDALDGTVVEFYPVPRGRKGAWVLEPGTSVPVAGGPQGIALTPTDVWVASRLSQTVTRINRATLQTVSIAVGDGPHSVLVTGGAVWVSDEYDGTIAQIDQSSNKVRSLPSGRGLAPRPGRRLRGPDLGGVRSLRRPRAPGRDSEGRRDFHSWRAGGDRPGRRDRRHHNPAQRFVYDGLVALGMSGGPTEMVVPDLAQGPYRS